MAYNWIVLQNNPRNGIYLWPLYFVNSNINVSNFRVILEYNFNDISWIYKDIINLNLKISIMHDKLIVHMTYILISLLSCIDLTDLSP